MSIDKDLLRKQNFSTVLFSFALIGCITFLLLVTYTSQKRIQAFALDQLRQDAEKRAEAVSYFYLERRNDLKSLAERRALSIFFENRALGMSMQYGLGDSLFAMGEQFGKLLDEKRLGKRKIFSRIIFMTNDGRVLAERGSKKPDGPDEAAHLARPEEGTDPEIRLIGEGRDPEVIATIPYYFKEKLIGKIIAYITKGLVHDNLLQAHDSSSRRTLAVTSETGSALYAVSGPAQTYAHGIKQRFPEMTPGETYRYVLHGDDGKGEEVIALRVHIRETPFYLVSVAPAEEILSWLSPAQLLFFMAPVCFLILTGMLLVTRMNTRKFVLQARLDEVAKSERVLEERNTLLQKEINERHQAEESLRNSEERFSTFMSHLPAAVSIKDPEGRLLFANQYSRHLYGREDCIGKTVFELLPAELANRKTADDRRALSQGLQVVIETIREGMGNERILETHKFPVPTGHGQTLLGAVSLDITERKRAEAEKERLESQLRQTQKIEAIGTLAGGIAHDFNNILVPIVGYTEMVLNDGSHLQPHREKLEQVLSAAYRARDLVKQLLALGRRGQEQHRTPVEISSIVEEVLKLLRASLPSTIEIRQEIESGVAMADGSMIHQVLMNLCTNASHAMNDEGLLEVNLKHIDLSEKDSASLLPDHLRPGPYLQLSVSDNGCGMDSATIARIFDPYFTTKEVGKGSGLGLAVVQGIVARHEGAITVRSEPGRGTRFFVYLPRLEAIASVSTNTVTALPTGNERILLIDDEQSIVRMETESLEQLGYKVTPRTDSLHALEVFRASPDEFDVLITDYTMPKLTGIDLTDAIRRIRPNIPVILCTGFNEKVTEEVVAIRAVELLMKPFNIKQLAELVRKALDSN
jgi:PAS domain S-box-containing protein